METSGQAMREIQVNDMQHHLGRMKHRVVEAVRYVLKSEGAKDYEISVALVDDKTIARLNRRFLGHRGATDVLSFDLAERGENRLRGEIVASAERAVKVAERRNGDPRGELLLYVVHGCLHLLGYDDRTAASARRMHARENQLLGDLGYPEAYGSTRGKQ